MMVKKVFIGVGCAILAVVIGLFIFYQTGTYGFHTTVNSVNVSMMSKSAAQDKVNASFSKREISLSGKYKVQTTRFVQEKLSTTIPGNHSFLSFLFGEKILAKSDLQINKAQEKEYLQSLLNANASKSKNAYISKTKDDFVLNAEVYGNQYNIHKVMSLLNQNLENRTLNIESCKKLPKIKEKDLKKRFHHIQKMAEWTVSYQDGVTSDDSDAFRAITCTPGGIHVNYSFLSHVVSQVSKKENTVGISRKFKSHSDKTITVSGGTYGWCVDTVQEYQYLKKKFQKGQPVTDREPHFLQMTHSKLHGSNDIGKTYIEVDLGHQHLWYYKNGKVIMDSGIVSGQKGLHDSPTGTFFISERVNGKYLVGDGYRSWVNKWMRLTNRGVGLHDATWRSRFGGNIYTYSGSHGCINLPYAFACKLFDKTYYGLCVVVHN